MVEYELLIRTIYTARQARENGYTKTAEALDLLVSTLSKHLDAEFLMTSVTSPSQSTKQKPRRLSSRMGSKNSVDKV